MRTYVLRRPIVFLRVRCSILILLIKTIRCRVPNCTRVFISAPTTPKTRALCFPLPSLFSILFPTPKSDSHCVFYLGVACFVSQFIPRDEINFLRDLWWTAECDNALWQTPTSLTIHWTFLYLHLLPALVRD